MCMLDTTAEDYRREARQARRQEEARKAVIEYYESLDGWEALKNLAAAGHIDLDAVVAQEVINGDF